MNRSQAGNTLLLRLTCLPPSLRIQTQESKRPCCCLVVGWRASACSRRWPFTGRFPCSFLLRLYPALPLPLPLLPHFPPYLQGTPSKHAVGLVGALVCSRRGAERLGTFYGRRGGWCAATEDGKGAGTSLVHSPSLRLIASTLTLTMHPLTHTKQTHEFGRRV